MKTFLFPTALTLLAAACSQAAETPAPAPAKPAGEVKPPAPPPQEPGRRGFDRMTPGILPEGWRAGTTGLQGPAATWSVVADPSASSLPNVLALTAADHGSSTAFNLCWDTTSSFRGGVLELAFRADAGTEDQGGGPAWRLRDENNYYLCRANPLESNFRLYVVKDGERKELASAEAKLTAGTWHRIRVEHVANRIVCTLDDASRLEAEDATLPDAGHIGLWTKADARTSFDDLVVRPAR